MTDRDGEFAHMLDLFGFLQNQLPWIAGVIGFVLVFYGLMEVKDLAKGQLTPRQPIAKLQMFSGTACVALAVCMTYFADALQPYPDLSGRWFYQVKKTDGAFSHCGECTIKQSGSKLTINGLRRFMCSKPADGKLATCEKVHAPWESTWAELCHDEKVRFDYDINLEKYHIFGACRVWPSDSEYNELIGTYGLIPPVLPEVATALVGNITFWRPKSGERLEDCLPTGG